MTTTKKTSNVATLQVADKEFLTAREAASYIGATINYFYKLTSSHRLPCYNPTGRRLLFRRSELEAWVLSSRVPTDDELRSHAELQMIKERG